MTTDRQLTLSLIYTSQTLGLIRAEVARIIRTQCTDVGALFEGHTLLQNESFSWQQAHLFVYFFQLLEKQMGGDEIKMIHWFRSQNESLGNSPFYLIIDEGRLMDVIGLLESDLKIPQFCSRV